MITPVEIDSCVSTRRTAGRQPSTRPNHSTTQRSLFAFFDTATLGEASGKQRRSLATASGRLLYFLSKSEFDRVRMPIASATALSAIASALPAAGKSRSRSRPAASRPRPTASPQSQVPDSPPLRPPAVGACASAPRRSPNVPISWSNFCSCAPNCLSTDATRSPSRDASSPICFTADVTCSATCSATDCERRLGACGGRAGF